jgi:hypothetical protein
MNNSITLSKAEWNTIIEALYQAVENTSDMIDNPDILEDTSSRMLRMKIKAYNKVQSKLIKLLDK